MNIENYLYYILYTLVYLMLAVLMRFILNLRSAEHYSADEEISSGNIAVGLRRSGAQLGLAVAMIGVLQGDSSADLVKDLIDSTLYGLLAVGFMLTSLYFTDKVMLPSVNNTEELKKGNVAIGLIEFGTLLMTGILAYASIKGETGGVMSSVVYFAAGQLTTVLLVLLYEKVFAKNLNPVACALEGNLSAGFYLSGKIIAYGLIIQSAIVGNSSDSTNATAAMEFAVAALAGMILLYLFELIIDKVIITSTKVSTIIAEDQLVAALQLSFAQIGMALILGMAIL